MALSQGTYLLNNRETNFYVLWDDSTSAGDPVKTTKVARRKLPLGAKINVSLDVTSRLYTLKSGSGLSIGVSDRTDAQGKRYLTWQDTPFEWIIEPVPGTAGLWNIKLPVNPEYAADNFTIAILLENSDGSGSDTHWIFTAVGA